MISCRIEETHYCGKMLTAVEEIESAILKLSPKELGQLAEWVLDVDEQNWDKQIERDSATRRLDFLTNPHSALRKSSIKKA